MSSTKTQPASIPALNDTLIDADGKADARRVVQTIEASRDRVSAEFYNFSVRNKSLLNRLFPTQLDRVLNDSELTIARTDCEYYERLHALACALKFEAAREAAEAWIKTMRLETRGALFTQATQKVESLREVIESRRVRFAEQVVKSYENAKKFEHIPALRDRYLQAIQDQIDHEFTWLDEQLEKFRASVTEGLDAYEKRALPTR